MYYNSMFTVLWFYIIGLLYSFRVSYYCLVLSRIISPFFHCEISFLFSLTYQSTCSLRIASPVIYDYFRIFILLYTREIVHRKSFVITSHSRDCSPKIFCDHFTLFITVCTSLHSRLLTLARNKYSSETINTCLRTTLLSRSCYLTTPSHALSNSWITINSVSMWSIATSARSRIYLIISSCTDEKYNSH